MATVYAKTTGVKVNMMAKGSGETLAQLNAEKANPKTDIWFSGTCDPHLQAAEQGLTVEYKSPQLVSLDPLAQKQAAYLGSNHEYTFDTEMGVIFVVSSELGRMLAIGSEVGLNLSAHGVSVVTPG